MEAGTEGRLSIKEEKSLVSPLLSRTHKTLPATFTDSCVTRPYWQLLEIFHSACIGFAEIFFRSKLQLSPAPLKLS